MKTKKIKGYKLSCIEVFPNIIFLMMKIKSLCDHYISGGCSSVINDASSGFNCKTFILIEKL